MPRDEHIDVLRALLTAPAREEGGPSADGLTDRERDALIDMLRWIEEHPRGDLSAKQWTWAKGRHEQLLVGDPAVRNANVPRGREVETPEVLRVLPKRPPARRSA